MKKTFIKIIKGYFFGHPVRIFSLIYNESAQVLPYTGHIQGADSHMGGKCDFALCLETLSIYKIPLTVYSIKTPVRITGFEVRWMVFGEISTNA